MIQRTQHVTVSAVCFGKCYVDLTVGQSYHELAKIAKDCAAGAVFIAAIAAVIVGSCLLVPPAIALVF